MLLQQAGFEAITLETEVVSDDSIEITKASAFLDERLDHPAWQPLKEAPQDKRDAIRKAYLTSITQQAIANRVPNKIALNLSPIEIRIGQHLSSHFC